jgi:hypothetical protein
VYGLFFVVVSRGMCQITEFGSSICRVPAEMFNIYIVEVALLAASISFRKLVQNGY